MSAATKLMLTVLIVAAAWFAGGIVGSGPVRTIASADLAGLQFAHTDAAALAYEAGTRAVDRMPWWLDLAALAAIIAVWFGPRRRFGSRRGSGTPLAVLAAATLTWAAPARAYFSTTDKTEAVSIMPNESAFWIPDTGNNKDSQASMDSESYYQANKIALTRFVIPHAKLANTGGWIGFDSYVPTGRMIIVDRAPYYREWTMNAQRGTSAKDESAPCQTKEGINITTEIGISTSVAEANSAKFLHFFGVNNPAGDRSDPQVIFASVYYGRSLAQVMDTIGRGLVHTAVCREIGSRNLDQANAEANLIMDNVQKEAGKFLGDRGITLEYMGWAGTWTFDNDIQRAINDAYTGTKVGPVLAQLQAKAVIDALEGWDKKLPASVALSWWPSSIGEALSGLVRTAGGK